MTDFNIKDLENMKWLIELKNNKPEEYKSFLNDIGEIMNDFFVLNESSKWRFY